MYHDCAGQNRQEMMYTYKFVTLPVRLARTCQSIQAIQATKTLLTNMPNKDDVLSSF